MRTYRWIDATRFPVIRATTPPNLLVLPASSTTPLTHPHEDEHMHKDLHVHGCMRAYPCAHAYRPWQDTWPDMSRHDHTHVRMPARMPLSCPAGSRVANNTNWQGSSPTASIVITVALSAGCSGSFPFWESNLTLDTRESKHHSTPGARPGSWTL